MKIVGQLVCGPGEATRYLKHTLSDFKRICDDIIVCLCNATEAEEKMVRAFDFRYYRDDREWGRWQYAIKTDLLRRIRLLEPDWILALDADESIPTLDRKSIEDLSQNRRAMQLYVVNLWDDEEHYARELGFWNVRLYDAHASGENQFLRKPVHCGNAPPFFYALPAKETYVPHILLHRGLMEEQVRARKVIRYDTYDPFAIHKGREYYDALRGGGRASIYSEEAVVAKITEFVSNLKQ